MVSVMAPATEEDWTMMVRMVPKAKKNRTEKMPLPVKPWTNLRNSGLSWMFGTESLSMSRPKKSRPNPSRNSPVSRTLELRMNIMGKPTPMMGRAMLLRLNLKPRKEMIQKVVVVPRFAPMIMPMDSKRVSRPALTKLTIITVVAEEDCTRQVTRKPESRPVKRFVVITRIMPRSFSPESFWSASLMIFMPKRKRPRLPRMVRKVRIMKLSGKGAASTVFAGLTSIFL